MKNCELSKAATTPLGIICGFSEAVQWKIPDFFSLNHLRNEYIDSPPFSLFDCRWNLRVFPKGEKTEGYMAVYLYKNDPKIATKTVFFSIGIKTEDGVANERPSNIMCTFKADKLRWGYPSFLDLSELRARKLLLLPSGALTFTCSVDLKVPNQEEVVPNPEKVDPQREMFVELEALSSDFKDLLSSERKYDVTMNVQGKDFRVHRTVLAARSSVFRAMYEHDTAEAKTGILTIPDCDPESFGDFLNYLYTGKLELSSDSAPHHLQRICHLYATAEKYDVQQLKSFCTDYVAQNISVENVCDVVILADKFCDDRLASCSQDFFNNNFRKIFLTSEWKSMMKKNVRLAENLLSEMAAKDSITT